jgi:hypothetical protein
MKQKYSKAMEKQTEWDKKNNSNEKCQDGLTVWLSSMLGSLQKWEDKRGWNKTSKNDDMDMDDPCFGRNKICSEFNSNYERCDLTKYLFLWIEKRYFEHSERYCNMTLIEYIQSK